ncbi:cytidine deaminase-like protein [Polyplosphaeria fusca]|uniref:Cytidine deaminase-like protein n=1 Tax=Polyplosphaeria fusca TaxID=682080 RepID=A0A9P4R012_9PLEO|nr:cytidine deaminase-like protein [Polyplosphaeria fusca]
MLADTLLSGGLEQLSIVARKGALVPLKTKDEVRAALETFEAYILEVPARWAGAVKDAIHAAIPNLKTADFQHLRRVVQFKYLPVHLQKKYRPPHPSRPRGDNVYQESEDAPAEEDDTARYFLISPVSAIAHRVLIDVLLRNSPFGAAPKPPIVLTISVPALAPCSAEQAAQWTLDYWPISYKNTNPFGPHPNLVARNALEIAPNAGSWLALAEEVGRQLYDLNFGEHVGCVIVDKSRGSHEIIAVAGDCRWRSPCAHSFPRDGTGNVMAHSVQRAIAMVAKKRLRAAGRDSEAASPSDIFCENPMTDLERHFYLQENLSTTGYLCVDMDMYVTHEPCVMCSMAILHSRFRRCVFGRRMPLTGGLTADTALQAKREQTIDGSGLGHGIFWRPTELNWKFLAWEWMDEDSTTMTTTISDTRQV